MTNNELLVEISNMMQVQLEPVRLQIEQLEEKMESRMDRLEKRIDALELRMEKLEIRVANLESRMDRLEKRIDALELRMEKLESRVDSLEERMNRQEMTAENQVMPILIELRACYTGTYERYSKWADRIEAMSQEIRILRQVVAEHGKKLERLN